MHSYERKYFRSNLNFVKRLTLPTKKISKDMVIIKFVRFCFNQHVYNSLFKFRFLRLEIRVFIMETNLKVYHRNLFL